MIKQKFSVDEIATLQRIERCPPAPESFDATAALRRLAKLADAFDAEAPGAEVWDGNEADTLTECARRIRHAIRGDE